MTNTNGEDADVEFRARGLFSGDGGTGAKGGTVSRSTNRSFQLFICFVCISVYAPLRVFALGDQHEHCGFLKSSGAKVTLLSTPDAGSRMDIGENSKVGFYNSSVRLRLTQNDYTETDQANYTVLAPKAGRLVSRDTDTPGLQVGAGGRVDDGQAAQGSGLRCEGGCMNYQEGEAVYPGLARTRDALRTVRPATRKGIAIEDNGAPESSSNK